MLSALIIADPKIPVPPNQYGGTERIVHLLCDGLARAGHKVRLLAGPNSRDYGGGLIIHRAPSFNFLSRAFRKLLFQVVSLWASRGVDVVINFGRPDYLAALLRTNVPLLCWFENPIQQTEVDYLLSHRGWRLRLVGVSESQLLGIRTNGLSHVIYNCVDTESLSFSEKPRNPPYLAFLGRMTRNKGVHLAIEAARAAGMRLVLAGNISDETGGAEYFETVVKPNLGKDCEWIGPVDDSQKRDLLAGASALLFPTQWHEPFAIVVAESLACGTPVIAWQVASTPEAIKHLETGFLCNSLDEMVAAINEVKEIDRKACRAEAEARFSQDALVNQTLKLIHNIKAEPAT